jgi:ATP-dependent DNA helicase RecQ
MASFTISDSVIDEVLSSVLSSRFPEIETISNEQRESIIGVVNRKDVFAILPTGHGKSLIFQIIPDICRELSSRGLPFPSNAIIVVVCPLKSLVDSHIRELSKRGIRATCLSADDDKGILSGSYSIVFGSPEQLLENEKWRNVLQSDVYEKNLFAFVADEAHVVPKW